MLLFILMCLFTGFIFIIGFEMGKQKVYYDLHKTKFYKEYEFFNPNCKRDK